MIYLFVIISFAVWCYGTTAVLLPYSFSVCEQAEKLEVPDHAFSVTSMSASIAVTLLENKALK